MDQAIALESLEAQGRDRAWARLIPMARCLDFLPRVRVDGPVMEKIGHGRPLTGDDLDPARIPAGTSPDKADGSVCLLDDSGALAAIVIWDKDGQRYNYSCVFST